MISGPPFPAGALLTSRPCRSTLVGMDSEENLPLRRDDPLTMLARQDLDPLSVAELDARIAALETEIGRIRRHRDTRSEEHTSELQSLMRISYAVFCLKKKKKKHNNQSNRMTTA